MKTTLAFLVLMFSYFSSYGQELSEEYRKLRDSALRGVMDEFYSTFMTKDNDSVLFIIDTSLLGYKDDLKIQAWKYCLKGQYYSAQYNADSATYYFERSAGILKPNEDETLYTRCKTTLCNIYVGTGRPELAFKALEDLKKELNSKSDPERYISYYSTLGNYYNIVSENKRSAESYFLAIDYVKKLDDGDRKDIYMASFYNDLGSVLPDKSKAVGYHKKARELIKDNDNYRHMVYECDVLIVEKKESKSTEEELSNLDSAIQYYKNIGSAGSEINGKLAQANVYRLHGNLKRSELKFLEILEQSNHENYREGRMFSSFHLGNIYYDKGENAKALNYLLQTIDYSTRRLELSLPSLLAVSDIYKQKGNFKKAYTYLNEYHQLQDSMEVGENKKAVKEIEAKYQSEKKQQEIAYLKSQNKLETEVQKRQRNQLVGGIVLVSIVGVFFFLLYRNRQQTTTKLQELDAAKSRFFENISHEFRTPLTLIKLPVSQALKAKNSLTHDQLSIVHNNASRLQNLIEDLLSLSEMEVGKLNSIVSTQNPLKQAHVISAQFESYAESKQIEYSRNIELTDTIADYDKRVVEKVLVNLITNAIKYTNSGGKIVVTVQMEGKYLKMKVSDNGSGISKQDQGKIFDRFYQINEKDEGSHGSGIGLALVKKILEVHNGTVSVSSGEGVGSIFTALLPVGNIRKEEPQKELITTDVTVLPTQKDLLSEVRLSNKPQLLIVEDNKELLTYIKDVFKNKFEIYTATNGKEGLEKAIDYVPDFIISDWMMPEMNGIQLCELIKTNAITSHIPFLLLTAKVNIRDRIKGYETGADAYIAKPFNVEELQAQIENLLNQRKILYEKYSDENSPTILSDNSRDIKFWEEFKIHLKSNLSDLELSTETMARALFMSRMQLHRKITALTGQSVGILIRNQRMTHATTLLNNSEFNISEICYEVGYSDNSSFIRAFKKEYGVSPTLYRKNYKK